MFDVKAQIVGALTESYLLETSRVSFQAEGERNFHVFYQILEGSEDWKGNTGHMKSHLGWEHWGFFDDDAREGMGKITYENGDKHEGVFVTNKKSGHGIMNYANGDYYEGDWKETCPRSLQCYFTNSAV